MAPPRNPFPTPPGREPTPSTTTTLPMTLADLPDGVLWEMLR
jgi:hypothetical protein